MTEGLVKSLTVVETLGGRLSGCTRMASTHSRASEPAVGQSLLAVGALLVAAALLMAACGGPGDRGQEAAGPYDVEQTAEIGKRGGLPAGDAQQASRQGQIWQPAPGTTWQWQLSGEPIDRSFDVHMYDIDLFESDAELVAALSERGRRVVCYLSAGSWEEFRPDAGQFPASVIGKDYAGWPGEKWLDIRQIELLAPIMRSRLDQCAAKGFDGIEPDNIDGYQADTGFSLTYEDQLRYNIWMAQEAHARGLSIGLKNVPEQVEDLLAHFDWALTEDCFDQGWCGELLPFINAGKAVFAAEYTDTGVDLDQACGQATELKISVIMENRELDAARGGC